MQEFIEVATRLADAARPIAQKYFRTGFDVISKSDASPVTIADREIETAMRDMLAELRPDDGILGEEFGTQEGSSGYTWVLDPIDGTRSFIMGRPTFGTLIALCKNDVPIVGVIDQPILGERWIGARGCETLFISRHCEEATPTRQSSAATDGSGLLRYARNDEKAVVCRTRGCASLKGIVSASTTPVMFEDRADLIPLIEAWGADCYGYAMLASGHMDMVLETLLSPYDFAALVPVVEGAGGFIRDWDGAPLTLKSDGRVIALGDAGLWPQVAPLLRG